MTRILAAVLGCLIFVAPALAAEQPCGPWEDMLLSVASHYGEYPTFLASSDRGAVIVITVNPDTGTYTVFAQPNEHVACAVDSGQGWNAAPEAVIDNIRDKVGSRI